MITDAVRQCLAEVDLDSVTKKQVRALVEQRLQTELVQEKRNFLDLMICGSAMMLYYVHCRCLAFEKGIG